MAAVDGARPHATLFLPPPIGPELDEIRRYFDPTFAAQMGPHITLTYPEETPDRELLAERLDALGRWSGPLPLRLTDVAVYGDATGGVHVRVEDPVGAYLGARAEVLAPPFDAHAVELAVPHVTLVHPRTSDRGPDAWHQLAGTRFDVDVLIERVALIAFDGFGWPASKVVPFTGEPW
jgi:2'-5' RNA ligase